MKEAFLHFIWKRQRFDVQGLRSECGQSIDIVEFGDHNHTDGPDFLNSSIRIDGLLWNGNVEMHLKSSLWYQHAHDSDPAYDNVILHVVLEDDRPVKDRQGQFIPTLVLKKRIPKGLDSSYQRLMAQQSWIPCQAHFQSIGEEIKDQLLAKVLSERLQRKSDRIRKLLQEYNSDWEQSFFQSLCRNLGLGINAAPSEALARSIPYNTLLRHRDRLIELEALLFGQAGMLDNIFIDEYPKKLKSIYAGLKNKYQLQPIAALNWKYLRMRPSNFPTIRIAQIARLLHQSNHLFSKILAAKELTELYNMFDLRLANYWRDHYLFDKPSLVRNKTLGKNTIQLLIINTIIPFLHLYAQETADPSYAHRAQYFLSSLPPEKNHLLTAWKKLGQTASNAKASQSLLELKNEYCSKKRCLDCAIGQRIIDGGLKSIELRLDGARLKR